MKWVLLTLLTLFAAPFVIIFYIFVVHSFLPWADEYLFARHHTQTVEKLGREICLMIEKGTFGETKSGHQIAGFTLEDDRVHRRMSDHLKTLERDCRFLAAPIDDPSLDVESYATHFLYAPHENVPTTFWVNHRRRTFGSYK
jgi:hypothetical protein